MGVIQMEPTFIPLKKSRANLSVWLMKDAATSGGQLRSDRLVFCRERLKNLF
jgi:hypothetical protein